MRRLRRSVLGWLCIACGLIGWIAFRFSAPAGDREQARTQAEVLAPFLWIGFLLLAWPTIRGMYARAEPSEAQLRQEWTGCFWMIVGALGIIYILASTAMSSR